jgi:hypothetical protein
MVKRDVGMALKGSISSHPAGPPRKRLIHQFQTQEPDISGWMILVFDVGW